MSCALNSIQFKVLSKNVDHTWLYSLFHFLLLIKQTIFFFIIIIFLYLFYYMFIMIHNSWIYWITTRCWICFQQLDCSVAEGITLLNQPTYLLLDKQIGPYLKYNAAFRLNIKSHWARTQLNAHCLLQIQMWLISLIGFPKCRHSAICKRFVEEMS